MYMPDKGDIVWLDFQPSAGKEITKRRPAFIISRKVFNELTGFAIVAPITNTRRGITLEVELEGMFTRGVVLIYQIKSLDFENRGIELIERALPATTNKVSELARLIIK